MEYSTVIPLPDKKVSSDEDCDFFLSSDNFFFKKKINEQEKLFLHHEWKPE